MKKTFAFLLAVLMVLGTLPALALGSSAAKAYTYTATNADGYDVTDEMSDGDIEDYLDGYATWYDMPAGYLWTVEQGRLVIAGVDEVVTDAKTAESYPWYNLRNEITEVFVFPNTVDAIGENAFASLSNVTYVEIGEGVTSIGAGALSCADDLTVVVPADLSVDSSAYEGCTDVTVVVNAADTLTVEPVNSGFANRDGATEMSFYLTDENGDPFVAPEGYSWKIFITDGEREDENGGWFSSALKLISAAPSSAEAENGLYRYEVCNLEGENQFIPQYRTAYVIGVQLYDKEGALAYSGISEVDAFEVPTDLRPIYEERTSALVTHGERQYIELDLGTSKPIGKVEVAFIQSSRVYNWIAYGSNDNTLPLSKWTFLGEKQNDVESDGSYTVEVESDGGVYGSYRYVRVYGTYNSGNWGLHFSEIAVYDAPPAYLKADFTATDFYGDDWTEYMTDGNYDEYMGYWGEHTWYDVPDGYTYDLDPAYVWNVEQGCLYIGGVGAVYTDEGTAESYPWYSLRDEITEVIVFPESVSSIGKNAFASLSNLTYVEIGAGVSEIGAGALACGAENLTVVAPSALVSSVEASLGSTDATVVANSAKKLTIAPVDAGFDNRNGNTELSFTLKDGSNAFEAPENYSWKLLIYDGKRYSREPADFICSAIKVISADPTSSENGTYRYEVCNLEGENQFIPQYESSYVIVAQLYDEDGKMVYSATSGLEEFTMDVDPIYETRTAAVVENSRHGYVLLDLGVSKPVGKINVGFCQASRYYQWVAYGSNDKDLPLSKWTFLGEKMNEIESDGSYAVEVDPGDNGYESFRYVRIVCTYNSANWGAHFAEVELFTVAELCTITWVVDGVSTTTSVMESMVPTMSDPVKDPVYGNGFETNYVFLGWSDGTTFYKVGTALPKATGNVTYTAVFEELTESWYDKGNINGDENVSILDVTVLLNYLSADEAKQAEMIENGLVVDYMLDVDESGDVSISDVTALLSILSGN